MSAVSTWFPCEKQIVRLSPHCLRDRERERPSVDGGRWTSWSMSWSATSVIDVRCGVLHGKKRHSFSFSLSLSHLTSFSTSAGARRWQRSRHNEKDHREDGGS